MQFCSIFEVLSLKLTIFTNLSQRSASLSLNTVQVFFLSIQERISASLLDVRPLTKITHLYRSENSSSTLNFSHSWLIFTASVRKSSSSSKGIRFNKLSFGISTLFIRQNDIQVFFVFSGSQFS